MEVPPISWVFNLLIILLTIFFTIYKFSTKSSLKLPPGPPKLPLIGNLHQLAAKRSHPHRRLAELARVYGPIMNLQLGELATIVVSSADMAKEVLKTHDAAFCSRPMLMLTKELLYGCTDIAMAPYGEYWRQVRKIATLELFTSKRVGSFRPIREEEVTNLMESIASQAGSVVNLSSMLFSLAFDITTRIAFSKKGKDQAAFRALTTTLGELGSGFCVADTYPSIKLLYSLSGMKRKVQELVSESNKILDPIIEEHKLKKKKQGNEKEDLIDVLLKFHKDNVNVRENEFSLSTDNIKSVILDLFTAGTETSSALLEWTMSELVKNPRVIEKAQSEVRQAYQAKAKGVIDEKKLYELKYLKLVIKETLRLHPPVPLLLPRESIEGCQIQNYDIPPKSRILVNAWAIGRDPEYWLEPDKFIPERFDDSSIDFKGNHFELIPFGAGRRGCPGVALGIANVELPLTMLLYHFNWKLLNKQPENLDLDEAFGATMRRKNYLLVIPELYP